ncbi:MAG: phosphoenolpyruvate synthase [Deltaproteobacteria bacterium]|nr:phosphoenolpyruvate synthase [Deltaproteobacteria bacterium]
MLVTLGTKAETLDKLRWILKHSVVLPQVRFTVGEWESNRQGCLTRIEKGLSECYQKVIIRSSAISEDSLTQSNAGRFLSVGNVDVSETNLIINAIKNVVDSYGRDCSSENQVFLQPFIEDVSISGVVLTRDLDTLGPYYIVNYDDESNKTDKVTSGRYKNLKTLIKFRGYRTNERRFVSLFKAVEEIEESLNCEYLDIEFAIDSSDRVYLFQVRPLVHSYPDLPETDKIEHFLNKIYKKIVKLNKPHPYLYGDHTIFGIMPDWNPAEMIGVKPRPLALSLYKYLITDRTWAYQRDNYGYKNLRSFPLIITFLGLPYIDVRVSFNSFIPKELDERLSSSLANYYLDSLSSNRSFHDKVEFKIILSCYFLNIDEKLQELSLSGFSQKDLFALKGALLRLTNNIVVPKEGVFRSDIKKIEHLKERQNIILDSQLSILEKIYWLIEDCCRYGTLPFAGIARAGFIAVQILQSFVSIGLISESDMNLFMSSLNTIAKEMANDHFNFSQDDFLAKYGHLRPGTYDIHSRRYDEAYQVYFTDVTQKPDECANFEFHSKAVDELDRILKREGLNISANGMIGFLKDAIEGREYAKFVFSRSISEAIRLIKRLALKYGLSADDASFLNINTVLQLYSTLDHRDMSNILKEESERNRLFYDVTKAIKLPPVIVDPEDVFEFELDEDVPNYVTLGRCQGEVVREDGLLSRELSMKIVFIAGADPGYDWIFSKNIAGLVTMYGGANSHMAIRAAELKIPSVIGAGEKNFKNWSRAEILEIDCEKRQVKVLR